MCGCLDISDVKQMVLIHKSVHFMGEDHVWDLGEDLESPWRGRQRGLFSFAKNSFCIPRLTFPRQGLFLPLNAIQWLLE